MKLAILCELYHDTIIAGQKTGGQELIGGLDCTVHRNFFGSQVLLTIYFYLEMHHNPKRMKVRVAKVPWHLCMELFDSLVIDSKSCLPCGFVCQ